MPQSRTLEQAPPEAGHSLRISVDGLTIAVFNLGKNVYAIDAACTHVGGPLERGRVAGNLVTCPLHGSQFDLETGAVRRGPATQPVKSYPIRIENNRLVIELP